MTSPREPVTAFALYRVSFDAQGEQGPPGQPGPPGPPGELPLLPPELADFQQSSLARWRRELNDIEATDDDRSQYTTTGGPAPAGGGDGGPKYADIVSSIYGMRQDLERIRKPVGTRENPVMTCKDLFYGHPQFKDGTSYYMLATYICMCVCICKKFNLILNILYEKISV